MSAKARLFWIIPALFVASWLTIQSLAASPAHERSSATQEGLGDPPAPLASLSRELRDPALSRYIRDQAVLSLGN